MELDYKVIATGSKGNAVRIENVLIDAGVPYAKLKDELRKVDTLFYSHFHGDHFKLSTLISIKKMYPHITVIANYEVAYKFPVTIISNENIPIKLKKGVEIIPFKAIHDVACQGLVMMFHETRVIFCTDTASMENAPDGKFDYCFLESNHDADKVKMLMGKKNKYGYDVFQEAQRHLSTQACKNFYYMRRRDKESPLIELHMSSRFY